MKLNGREEVEDDPSKIDENVRKTCEKCVSCSSNCWPRNHHKNKRVEITGEQLERVQKSDLLDNVIAVGLSIRGARFPNGTPRPKKTRMSKK